MLNSVYRLVYPRVFEPVEVDIRLDGRSVIVRPTHLSICNADLRYYQGTRSAAALAQKLPMALIHEGIGEVVYDATSTFNQGALVVMIPNSPHETDPYIAENYLRSSRFCGSGFDGFMQEYLVLPPERVVELPQNINRNVAAFTELLSVAVHAINRFESFSHSRRNAIGIWGDGNVAYLVSLILRTLYPEMHLVLFGRNDFKMSDFTFVDEAYFTHDVGNAPAIDHAFECCGGEGSAQAIDQIIDLIQPEGTISLLGVSEAPPAINTRMVLEKGLRLFGSSRSGRVDFECVVNLYQSNPAILGYLEAMVHKVVRVSSIYDMVAAFEADAHKPMGKTIMEWNL